MIRKHTRRAAKAAFAISLGVAIVLGGTAAVASAKPQAKPTIIVGNKNFTEEFILGQLYGQALKAKGYPVKYAGSLGSSELADTAIKSGKINLLPEYTGVIVLDLAKGKATKSAAATYAAAKKFTSGRSSCSSSSTVGTTSRLPTISYAIFVNLLGFGLAGLVRIREGTISGTIDYSRLVIGEKSRRKSSSFKKARLMLRLRALRVT